MATKQIHDYTAATGIDASADYLLIDPASSGIYNKINRNTLLGITGAPVGTSDSQTLTNKVIGNTNTVTLKDGSLTVQNSSDTTKQAVLSLSGITTGTTRTYSLPDATTTLVGTGTTQTLTNKTLTSPTISGGTIDNTAITVDSISGHSTSTIVTVGGVQMNNGTIGTSGAVTSTSIAAGAVQPQSLVSGTGTSWSPQSYTPTWTGLTVGNGTNSGTYVQIGKFVFATVTLTFGSTSSVSGANTFTLPVTSLSLPTTGDVPQIGYGGIIISGVAYRAIVLLDSTTQGKVRWLNPQSAVNNIDADTTSTAPGTFNNGSVITCNFWYTVP